MAGLISEPAIFHWEGYRQLWPNSGSKKPGQRRASCFQLGYAPERSMAHKLTCFIGFALRSVAK